MRLAGIFAIVLLCRDSSGVEPFDLVFEGAQIVDGSGNPWFAGDVAVRGERIVAVGTIGGGRDTVEARRRIDCRGLVVAPGFIDIHSHSDLLLLEDPRAESKVRQGVTTEVLGEGESAGPRKGKLPPAVLVAGDQRHEWTTLAGYLDAIESRGVAVNVASYVGQGTVWQCVLGDSFREPSAAEVAAMENLVAEAMEEGAFGLSTMLGGPPGLMASTDLLVKLSRVAGRHGGIYSSHIRNEGLGVLDAVAEAIAIGERAGVPVDIIHLKIADRALWGRMDEVVARIEAARRRGVEVHANVYPYTRGNNNLASIIPPWAHEGGKEALIARLRDPEARVRIRREIREGLPGWYNHYLAVGGEWSRMLVNGHLSEKNRRFEGQTMDRVVAARSQGSSPAPDPLDLLCDFLIEEDGSVGAIYEHHQEADMNLALIQPWCSIGSDGLAHAVDGPTRRGWPHPRSFGTFARVLGVYVRERKLLRLEEAVRKMTSLNARKLGLADRGLVRVGCFADLVVFDPERIADRSSYLEPFQYAEGVEWTIVNGTVVLDKGKHTNALPGRALRKVATRGQEAPVASGWAALRSASLRAVVADNQAHGGEHRAGYSGLAELAHGRGQRSLFVPAFAGLNFEHIFSGDAASFAWDIFEPRKSPMTVERLGPNTVALRQERTASWPLRSTIAYEVAGDDAVDLTLRAVPLEDAWRKHGYIGLFFASYIEKPEDMAIHWIGHERSAAPADARPRWIRHLPQRHGEAACHRACGVDWDPPVDPGFPISLASGHSNLEYDYPFYYGISRGKVFILMLERPRHGAEARFAQSPSGGGDGNPAWDFVLFKRGYDVGKEFQFRARAVYRDYRGREDVIRAYEEWSGERVEDPGT